MIRFLSPRSSSCLTRFIATQGLQSSASSQTQTKAQKTESSNPLENYDYFNIRNCFTMQEMFEAKVHLGHKEGTLNPLMRSFVVGSRLGHLIIDLEQSRQLLGDALNFTAHIASRGGIILFVTRSRQSGYMIEKLAKEVGEYAHTHDFRPATFSNPSVIFGTAVRLPDLLILFGINDNVMDTNTAVEMAAKLLIPTIGICDTNSDPTLISYPVPGNDDTPCAIEFYCRVFKKAILAGKSRLV